MSHAAKRRSISACRVSARWCSWCKSPTASAGACAEAREERLFFFVGVTRAANAEVVDRRLDRGCFFGIERAAQGSADDAGEYVKVVESAVAPGSDLNAHTVSIVR